METPFGTGALESEYDYRTLQHDQVGAPQLQPQGGIQYEEKDILHQHRVGICTSISLIQNVLKATGKRYSEDFQYLLQKTKIDNNWDEGSSPSSALRIAKNFGLLPIEYLPSIVENNPNITYPEYVEKLKAINVTELLTKCEFPVKGYAQVNVNDDILFAIGLLDSKAGLLCRFVIGNEWWTAKDGRVSWDKKDIEPLRPPKTVISGHQIIVANYDYDNGGYLAETANTWGKDWCNQGSALFDMSNYRPTEAWTLYYDFNPQYVSLPPAGTWSYTFKKPMHKGEFSEEVKNLQIKLLMEKCISQIKVDEYGYYGARTSAGVLALQIKKGIPLSWYEKYILRGSVVGPKTLAILNQ